MVRLPFTLDCRLESNEERLSLDTLDDCMAAFTAFEPGPLPLAVARIDWSWFTSKLRAAAGTEVEAGGADELDAAAEAGTAML